MTNGKLDNKVMVITGAGGTLCSALARHFAGQGASIAVLDLAADAADAVAKEIEAGGGRAIGIAADVTDVAAVRKARDVVRRELGECRILINGAGGNQMPAITTVNAFTAGELGNSDPELRGFFNLDMKAFQRVSEVNLMGTVIPCQVFGEDIVRAGGGAIVNFASMNALRPLSRVPAYAAAKAGIANFTQWLAAYLACARVRVNAVAPGFFLNEKSRKRLTNSDGSFSERGRNVIAHTPMARFGEAEELIGCIRWLIDDDAAGFVTGITVPVDGGFMSCSGV